MIRTIQSVVLGLASLSLLAVVGCSSGYGHDRYGYDGRSHDYDRAREAGYDYNNTRAADRATGMTPREYYNNTRPVSPENYGTTHADRVEHHEEHENHLDKAYGD